MRRHRCLPVAALVLALSLPLAEAQAAPTVGERQISSSITKIEVTVQHIDVTITPFGVEKNEGKEKVVTLSSDVLFDFGSAALSDTAKKKIAELMKKVPKGVKIRVDGHTDNIPFKSGSKGNNQTLSQDRAQSVADVIKGSRSDLKTEVHGYGDTKPVAQNQTGGKDNPEGRAKNRRVEIRYTG